MAGHSHWSNIQHKKGIADSKRGKVWSKLSRHIMIAARNGGGDLAMNLRLRYAIDAARAISMPKENIERAVKKGCGELDGVHYEEICYEGFAQGGSAILVEVLTDNRNRSNGEIRKIFEKGGGHVGSVGCAAHLLDRKGVIIVLAALAEEDAMMALALEAGADDMNKVEDHYEILTDPSVFHQVLDAIHNAKLTTVKAELMRIPREPVELNVENGTKVAKLIEALEDHDDVQHVYSTAHISEESMAELHKG